MPSAARQPPAQVAALQLHVSLNEIEPPIWRRFWVEETITLGRLHEVLQIVMGWEHTLLLEQVVLIHPMEQGLPWCIVGRRACPPEDVAGTGGYGSIPQTIADPTHPEHSAMLRWGQNHEPERFDRKAVNTAL